MKIIHAQTADDIGEVKCLFREYEEYLGVDLCFQNFEEELAGLPGRYAPPSGVLLLALEDQGVAGCVALRKLEDSVCEMRIIEEAIRLDYSEMRLDTLNKLKEARKLYESLGFKKIEPYCQNPLPGVEYWELNLNEIAKRIRNVNEKDDPDSGR
jgi:putative acetyltransferase